MIMNKLPLKRHIQRLIWWTLNQTRIDYCGDDLKRSAIIFSPHFDDEILSCGGTILKKKKAGSKVKIVFMIDGSKSHCHLISEDEIKAIRIQEALSVSRSLGLERDDVFFLLFKETKLNEHLNIASQRVAKILRHQQPEEIFIPYCREPVLWSQDHLATNRIVLSALKKYRRTTIIYEYPLWFWYCWPWASINLRPWRAAIKFLKRSVFSSALLILNFRCCVYIGDILDIKQEVLNQYKSQMTRFNTISNWKILSDVSNGEFLECFFQECEIFSRYVYLG